MTRRRTELAAFLRSRRERISPADAGLLPGTRRRTPGLRREELAQLAGVGVTWYTWLEQGRPINASVQVLGAIARTLRLDHTEVLHLYHLADVPSVPALPGDFALPPEIQVILDQLSPLGGCVYNSRYDLLAWNRQYQAMFGRVVAAAPEDRNVLWQSFMCPDDSPFVNRLEELPVMVATLRSAFGRHLGEPTWTELIQRLSAISAEFVTMWQSHDVAEPGSRVKVFRHPDLDGHIRLSTTSLTLTMPPETRMIVYTPTDELSRHRLEQLSSR